MNDLAEIRIRIDTRPPSDEAYRVEQAVAPYREMLGRVPAGFELFGVSPTLLEHYAGSIDYYMTHPRLSQPLLTFIRYLVSWNGQCPYCVDLNEAFLVNAGFDLARVRSIREDPLRAPLEEQEKAMLMFALDAVDRPESISTKRTEALKALGWTDRDLFDAVWHATTTRAFGRTAEAFGLPPDGFIG